MKKLIVSLLFAVLCLSCVTAFSFRTGAFGVYSKDISKVRFGITGDVQIGGLAVTQDIDFISLKDGNVDIESTVYLSSRSTLLEKFYVDFGAGLEMSIEKHGDEKFILTTHGKQFSTIFKDNDHVIKDLFGMIKLRDSIGLDVTDHLTVRVDNAVNSLVALIFKDNKIFDSIRLNDIIIGVMFKW